MSTFLLTACIHPSGSTPGKSSDNLFLETRNQQYLTAIKYYIEESNCNAIVLCDNTNSNFDTPERKTIKELGKKHHKKIELLSFDGNKKSHIYGYGYGEAEIFDYAYSNSQLLQQAESRYKITGRYLVKDINTIISRLASQPVFFQKQGLFMTPFTISTAFFKITNAVYKKYLYKTQTKLYEEITTKDYVTDYYFKDHFPLERVRYCLLYPYVTKEYHNMSGIEIDYLFPLISTHGVARGLRSIIYKLYVTLGYSQFPTIHRILHRYFFVKKYHKAIKDGLF